MSHETRPAVEAITDRQREVARLIAEGHTNPEIADALGITLAGAKYHVSELLGRLGLQRREEIGEWYRREGAMLAHGGWRRVRGLVAMPAAWVLGGAAVVVAIGLFYAGLDGARVTEPGDAVPALVAPAGEPTEAVRRAGEESDEERLPIFHEHRVEPGETVGSIANRYGIAPRYIEWNNVDVPPGTTEIERGTVLQIPGAAGILHSVRAGDTIAEIAARYDADPRDILDFGANGLDGDPANLRPDMVILVPGGRLLAPSDSIADRSGSEGPSAAAEWVWPLRGRLISLFSPDHPQGIDIAADVGTPVVAASDGEVVFVGGDSCCGYGFHVIIDHGNGYESVYAQLNNFDVMRGDAVEAGDIVGWSGATGRIIDEPMLHFEIRRNGIFQDPLSFLP